jgi:RNA 2',3'-cyclic 3'-phosphodiesterase
MSDKKRLFTGIKVEFTEKTLRFYQSIPEILEGAEIKWVEPGNMHITLKFFGDIESKKMPEMVAKLKIAAKKFKESEIMLKGIGIFKDFYHPKVLWLGLRDCPQLETIKNEIENSTGELGFEIDYRKFMPHLTIGRFKKQGQVNQLQKLVNMNQDMYFQMIPVKELILFESILKTEGPEYKVIEKIPFGADEEFKEFRF